MEITLYDKMTNPLEAVDRLGVALAKSGMFGCDNENAGKVLAMICMSERKSPVELLRQYDIIGGKLRKKALAISAEFRAKGGKIKWLLTGDDGKEAKAEFTFEGQTITANFTLDMANKQGLVKPNSGWAKTPANMLRARLLSNAISMLAPEIVAGEEVAEEVTDAIIPQLNLPATAAAPVQTPAPAIEVQAVAIPQPSSEKPAPTPPPVQPHATTAPTAEPTAETVAAPSVSKPAAASPSVPGLADDLVAKLETAIGEAGTKAGAWFIKEGWLKPGEGLAQLSEARANRILKQTASFLRAVNGSAT